jgi:hypothetical protein
VGRDDAPLVYYMATPEGECDFPTLLRSRGERVVRLIERPPQLRLQGFEIWAGDASEILQGKMRRNMLSGSRLIELWNPGTNPSTTLPRHGDFSLMWIVSGLPLGCCRTINEYSGGILHPTRALCVDH